MKKESSVPMLPKAPFPTVPLPIALYESNGLIFELYQGGQAYQPVVVQWKRLKTVTVTLQDNSDHKVRVSQREKELPLPGE